jgi:hypothetical protein
VNNTAGLAEGATVIMRMAIMRHIKMFTVVTSQTHHYLWLKEDVSDNEVQKIDSSRCDAFSFSGVKPA